MSNEYGPKETLNQEAAKKITSVIENVSNIAAYTSGEITVDLSSRILVPGFNAEDLERGSYGPQSNNLTIGAGGNTDASLF